MATQREIRKRIKSVASTKKITKTMEMISTSKMKKMQVRFGASKPFAQRLENIIYNLQKMDFSEQTENLFKPRPDSKKSLIIVITGNRGLCGGYNTNVIESTLRFREDLINQENKDVQLQVIGQKGINFFKFTNLPLFRSEKNAEDKVTFDQAGKLATDLIESFINGDIDEVYVSYTKVFSSSTYKPAIIKLLPDVINEDEKIIDEEKPGFTSTYIFEPEPEKILASIVPLYVKVKLYLCLLESGYAEQSARRVAMKNATDAATDMVKDLTVKYNRARQAKITNEIAEIVGGASAL